MNSRRPGRIRVTAEQVDRFLDGGTAVPEELMVGYALDDLSPDDRVRLEESLAGLDASEAEAVWTDLDSLREAASRWTGDAGKRRLAELTCRWRDAVRPAPVSLVQGLVDDFAAFVDHVLGQCLVPMLEGAQAAEADRPVDRPPNYASIARKDDGAHVRFASSEETLAGAEIHVEHGGDRRTYRMELERPGVVSAEIVVEGPRATIEVSAPPVRDRLEGP